MRQLIDFDAAQSVEGIFYGGDAGAKEAVMYKNDVWMLKYPKTTRDLVNPQISYTTSPLSEYVGSKIYGTFNISVHETLLGKRRNKVVAACKDFLYNKNIYFVPFHDLKNSFMAGDLESYSGTGSETLLDEVLATIKGQKDLQNTPNVTERFWDMFVIDAFIGNNDRNNGNWGNIIDRISGSRTLAPVFDNGNAFFNKRSLAQMSKRMDDDDAMRDDAYKTPLCVYKYTGLDNEGQKINPFDFIKRKENADCNAAVLRFKNTIQMPLIKHIIDEIPETAGNLSVMPAVQKEFYLKIMQLRLEQF